MASGRQRYSIISDGLPSQLPDIDPDETREWVESFDDVVQTRGRGRARYVPAAPAGVVRRYLRRGEQAEAVLAEISAINAELLARRELR